MRKSGNRFSAKIMRRQKHGGGRRSLVSSCPCANLFFAITVQSTVETLNAAVDAEIEALPADMRARLVRLVDVIEQVGLQALPRDSVKHLEGKLWELRFRA